MGLRFCHGPPILLRASYFFMGLRFCHGPPIFLRASDSAMGLRFCHGPPIFLWASDFGTEPKNYHFSTSIDRFGRSKEAVSDGV
ncbi:hypothetical protein CRE_03116 [Caenorhabditis remanei]|uniref:Uncharacterized protein n=1 Tax=Caenorhabditis remanei TaxID=31234 RepID=E3LWM2_CAERE|nr:hypothetical protein CRE_03116 [Caenorhabditis remanei]